MITDVTNNNKPFLRKLYDNVIYPNIYIVIVIAIIIGVLVYRYYQHKKEKPSNETKSASKEQLTNVDIEETEDAQYTRGLRPFGGMDDPNERIARPTLNPSIPISRQRSYVNYLPDEIPVIKNGMYQNNVKNMNYLAPNYNPNNYQYSGTYYNTANNNLSDDVYNDFYESSKQNLMEYDDLLGQSMVYES
jgi:hypothetical protein